MRARGQPGRKAGTDEEQTNKNRANNGPRRVKYERLKGLGMIFGDKCASGKSHLFRRLGIHRGQMPETRDTSRIDKCVRSLCKRAIRTGNYSTHILFGVAARRSPAFKRGTARIREFIWQR